MKIMFIIMLWCGCLAPDMVRADSGGDGGNIENKEAQRYALESAAFGVSPDVVSQAHAYHIGDWMGWNLMALSRHSGKTPDELMALRGQGRSWGEMCALWGLSWPDLVDEVQSLASASGLVPRDPLPWEMDRACSNMVRPLESGVAP